MDLRFLRIIFIWPLRFLFRTIFNSVFYKAKHIYSTNASNMYGAIFCADSIAQP